MEWKERDKEWRVDLGWNDKVTGWWSAEYDGVEARYSFRVT